MIKLLVTIFMSTALLASDLPEQKDARPPLNPILSPIPILGWLPRPPRFQDPEVRNVAFFTPDGRHVWIRDIKVVPRMFDPRAKNKQELESVE